MNNHLREAIILIDPDDNQDDLGAKNDPRNASVLVRNSFFVDGRSVSTSGKLFPRHDSRSSDTKDPFHRKNSFPTAFDDASHNAELLLFDNHAYNRNRTLSLLASSEFPTLLRVHGSGTVQDPVVLEDDASPVTRFLDPVSTAAGGNYFTPMTAVTDVQVIEDDDELDQSQPPLLPTTEATQELATKDTQRDKLVGQMRNPPLTIHQTQCNRYIYNGLDLRIGKAVESKDGSFLRITAIIRNLLTGDIRLRGNSIQRTRDLNGMLERKINEVCLYYEIDLDDTRSPPEQSVLELPVEDVVRLRTLRCTNRHFPDCRATDPTLFHDKRDIEREGGLTLRWKYTCTYASATDRQLNCYKERTLEHITESECAIAFAISNAVSRYHWRGKTELGGSYNPSALSFQHSSICNSGNGGILISANEDNAILGTEKPQYLPATAMTDSKLDLSRKRRRSSSDGVNEMDNSVIPTSLRNPLPNSVSKCAIKIYSSELSSPPPTGTIQRPSLTPQTRNVIRSPGQTLTYGDGFCGAGGSTRGAAMAGLKIVWGFDQDEHACASWSANFPDASCYNMSSDAFVKFSDCDSVSMKVDIMHLSPPCQYFSPAHTVNGTNDERNVASLFAVGAIIEVGKPRVVTLEQTFGLRLPKFRQYFAALVHMFTSLNFSVRWAIVPLSQWGLPQRRFRLLVIASCPGEILPEMPPPTHSENGVGGLKPLVTVNETLNNIPKNAPDHCPESVPRYNRRPWDANVILPRAMTCHGGQNYHPSGTRDLTLREYACLQGFPHNHIFRGSHVKRQIGNAVPPSSAKVLFEYIKAQLDEADGVLPDKEIIFID